MIRLLPITLLALVLAPACTPSAVDGGPVGEGEGEGEGGEGEGGEGEGEAPLPTPTATLLVSPVFGAPADGVSSVEVTVQLEGEAVAGRVVALTTSEAGPDTVASVVSGADGSARFSLVSSIDGRFTLELEVDGELVAAVLADDSDATVRFNPCASLAATYATEAFPLAFSRCIGCHNEFGYAPMMGARFVLPFPGDEDFAARGVAAVRDMIATTAAEGSDVDVTDLGLSDEDLEILQLRRGETVLSRVLVNPLLGIGHSGGVVFSKSEREEVARFRGFISRLGADDTCGPGSEHGLGGEDLLASTTLLSPKESFKRAQLSLTGLNVSSSTLGTIVDEASLSTALDTLLNNRRVEERLLEIWNDWLLTDRAMGDIPNYLGSAFPRRLFFNALQSEGARGVGSCNDSTPSNCCRVPENPLNLDDNDDNDVPLKAANVACIARQAELRVSGAREPLELLRHIWRDQLPAETLLQADFTYVNPSLAKAYGQLAADNRTFLDGETQAFNGTTADDSTEFRLTRVLDGDNAIRARTPNPAGWSHQGVLSMPSFLARYPTTVSNRERTRARAVYELFLGVPVMKLAAFATPEIPPGQSLENLTWETQPCIVCHALLDPVAATFNHYTGTGANSATTRPCRSDGMRSPGFGFIALPGEDTDDAGRPRPALDDDTDCAAPVDGVGEGDADNRGPARLKWLADRVVEHPRFAYAVIVPLYEGLIGTRLLSAPDALADPDFGAKARAYVAQQKELQALVAVYRAGGGRLRSVVKAILQSRSFRADTIADGALVDGDRVDERLRAIELMEIGHKGKLLTPELLNRRLTALTGLPWAHIRSTNRDDALSASGAYAVFWGGIDSEVVTERSRDPVAVRAAVARRMGHEVSCVVVPQEFSIVEPTERKLLREIEPTASPVKADGSIDTAALALVRAQIVRLHGRLWAEAVVDDVEVDASLALFVAAQRALRAPADGAATPAAIGVCQAVSAFVPGTRTAYPATGTVTIDDVVHRRVSTDPDFTVRAWMAVMSSLIADARFIME